MRAHSTVPLLVTSKPGARLVTEEESKAYMILVCFTSTNNLRFTCLALSLVCVDSNVLRVVTMKNHDMQLEVLVEFEVCQGKVQGPCIVFAEPCTSGETAVVVLFSSSVNVQQMFVRCHQSLQFQKKALLE